MAKQFFYVCLGVLCLVAAHQLGVERAQADWDPSVSGEIVGVWAGVGFTRTGEAWTFWNAAEGWLRAPNHDLPVPVSEVKFIDQGSVITIDDVAWRRANDEWVEIGPFPGGPVPLQPDSWGKIKDRYRD